MIAETRLPAVAWGRAEPPAAIASVDVDQQAGARLAADHLVARGCRRIATIHAPLTGYAGRERLAGFRRLQPQAGIIVLSAANDTELVAAAVKAGAYQYVTKPFRIEPMKRVTRALFAELG